MKETAAARDPMKSISKPAFHHLVPVTRVLRLPTKNRATLVPRTAKLN